MNIYSFYIDGVLLPQTPGKLKIVGGGRNRAVSLLDGGEVTIINAPPPAEISFDFTLPAREGYPFARYEDGFKTPEFYIEMLSAIRAEKRPTRLTVGSDDGRGIAALGGEVSLDVTIEKLEFGLDAADGPDTEVSIVLKAYVPKAARIVERRAVSAAVPAATVVDMPIAPRSYTVVRGDCLWLIAKRLYGDGARYMEIYNANTGVLSSPDKIYPGQVLVIP